MEMPKLCEYIPLKSVQLGGGDAHLDATAYVTSTGTIVVNRPNDPHNFPISISLPKSSALELAAQICKRLTFFQSE